MGSSSYWEHVDPDSFGRPAKRTRPRTKDRPDYSKLPIGQVIGIDRGRYRCIGDNERIITAKKARQLGRTGVIIGDRVRLSGDVSGDEGTLARIVEVCQRSTVLRRTADDTDPYERPIVANADQLMVVCALADPPPRPGMIDRILVAAYQAKVDPIICLTKADLDSPDQMIDLYSPLDVPVVVTDPDRPTDQIVHLLADHVTVLVGHSGVGKSTLINRVVPAAGRETGHVNQVTGRGRHTSTSAVALPLVEGGWVIDTPGVRSFGLSHVEPNEVLEAFADLAEFVADCPRGCRHTARDEQCGLDRAVDHGDISTHRLASFRRIIEALLSSAYAETR